MPFTMTKADALKVQREQLLFYCARLTPVQAAELNRRIAAGTQANQLNDGQQYPVSYVNRYIPRGSDIEHEITLILQGRQFPA